MQKQEYKASYTKYVNKHQMIFEIYFGPAKSILFDQLLLEKEGFKLLPVVSDGKGFKALSKLFI